MAKQKVAILGATGMLGSMLLDTFSKSGEFELTASYRNQKLLKLVKNKYPLVKFRKFDAERGGLISISRAIKGAGWIVNVIGIIKPHIRDDNPEEIRRAVYLNSFFPHLLAQAAQRTGSKVIQIATDCVFSGRRGKYVETDPHDPMDVYGKTKSLGEVYGKNTYHLRCSVVGSELKGHNSLLDWFLGQAKGAHVNGFTNHIWNGITGLHFARICVGIIKGEVKLPHIQHILPKGQVTKAELLKIFAREFGRGDVIIWDMKASEAVNRTLSTNNMKLNRRLWKLAGYKTSPTIREMIGELA